MADWKDVNNILVIESGNAGDLLMCTPALRALKASFGSRVTVLISNEAESVAFNIAEINEVIVANLPWQTNIVHITSDDYGGVVSLLKEKQFDAAIIFSAYTDNSLPAALLAFQAGIPKRLAYCREEFGNLLTNSITDKEPYSFIQHQVERNLSLVASVGAKTHNNNISVHFSSDARNQLESTLSNRGVNIDEPYIVLHADATEKSKEFPAERWAEILNGLYEHVQSPVLLIGSIDAKQFDMILSKCKHCIDLRGQLSVDAIIATVAHASLLFTVNCTAMHIAAGTHTPVVVLYALTNPQYTPWKVPSAVLPFSVTHYNTVRNEAFRYVFEKMPKGLSHPDTIAIVKEAIQLIAIVKPAVLQRPIPVLHN